MFAAQGGIRVLDDRASSKSPPAPAMSCWPGRRRSGQRRGDVGRACCWAQAVEKKGDQLDFVTGITLHENSGDYVHKGRSLSSSTAQPEPIGRCRRRSRQRPASTAPEKPEEAPLVYALVTKDGVERY